MPSPDPDNASQGTSSFPSDRRRGPLKRKRETPAQRAAANNRSSRTTPNAYSRRTPPRSDRSPRHSDEDSLSRKRSRSRSRSRSPPVKQLKRPGAGARITPAQREAAEAARRARLEKERAEVAGRASSGADLVASHYNAVPERGREWRKTDSQIKGLRSLNNWIKSTLIQKFSRSVEVPTQHLTVLDMACGKGGDLGKWEKAPQVPSLYVGCDIAEISIEQARDRYAESQRKRGRFNRGRGGNMEAQFYKHDAFKDSFADIPIVRQVGFNPHIRASGGVQPGMPYGNFDVVSMMFALHYSFENEELARGMLANVAGALKKGGRFIGVMPNADVITAEMKRLLAAEGHGKTPSARTPNRKAPAVDPTQDEKEEEAEDDWDPEKPSEPLPEDESTRPAQDDDEDDWDPEKPSEPVITTTAPNESAPPASFDGATKDNDDDWNPEKPSEAMTSANLPSALESDQQPPPPSVNGTSSATPAGTSGVVDGPPLEWGNSIYSVTFPRSQPLTNAPLPSNGIFRPAFGWKYVYHLVEAVDAPEFVVPFESLRLLAEDYGLELQYRKGFREVLEDESEDRDLGMLAERMGVKSRDRSVGNGSGLMVGDEEMEAAGFYHAFCFYRT